MAMPPERREQVLEKLPPQQQANLRQRLDRFDKLPAAERARLNQMWSTFNSLSPEKQAIVTRQMQAFNSLPEARREDLKPVLQRLRRMPEDRRNALLNNEAFKNRFSASEVQMLTDIAQNYPLPGRSRRLVDERDVSKRNPHQSVDPFRGLAGAPNQRKLLDCGRDGNRFAKQDDSGTLRASNIAIEMPWHRAAVLAH